MTCPGSWWIGAAAEVPGRGIRSRCGGDVQIGGAAGAGVAAAMIQQKMLRPGVWSVLGGAAVGTTVGLLAHGATAPKKTKAKTEGAAKDLAKDVKDSIDKMG